MLLFLLTSLHSKYNNLIFIILMFLETANRNILRSSQFKNKSTQDNYLLFNFNIQLRKIKKDRVSYVITLLLIHFILIVEYYLERIYDQALVSKSTGACIYNYHMANKKNVWSAQEEEILFSSHATMGSKWATIANLLPGKDQSSIKNKFYSTLRRGHRKINSYITEIKRKSDPTRNRACKVIDDIFISKLIAVVDQSYEEKYQVKPAALALAANIERNLIELALSDFQYMKQSKDNYNMEEGLLENILEFSKSCKRRKGKRGKSDKKKIDKNEEEIEESEMIPQSKQDDEIKLEQKSDQINVKTEEQLGAKPSQGEEFKVQFSSFLKNLQRKESTSTIINNFSSMANEFIKNYEYFPPNEQVNLIQSANNMTHSGCLKQERPAWMYDSSSSRRSLPKRLSNYLTEPSPFPNDPYSPFTFNNIMKNKNITGSNMFEDKISCNQEEMAASGSYQKDPLGSFINLVPIAKSKTGEFLIKSADLKRQINEESPTFSSMKFEKDVSTFNSLFPNIDQKHFANIHHRSFANQYAFQPTTVPNPSESANLATSSQSPQDKANQ